MPDTVTDSRPLPIGAAALAAGADESIVANEEPPTGEPPAVGLSEADSLAGGDGNGLAVEAGAADVGESEDDEAERCQTFLRDASPKGAAELEGS